MYITQKQLNEWATQIANVINYGCGSDGECKDFEHDLWVNDEEAFTAMVSYYCDTEGGNGIWWSENERTSILWVTDPDGREIPELIKILENMLN